jgi:DNA-binding PadR family transcriptional regulator
MKGSYLGEFQEIVLLAVLVLDGKAYGVTIQNEIYERINRQISRGALHSALTRLLEKGFLESELGGATAERGGRQKKYFTVTNQGKNALEEAAEIRKSFYGSTPNIALDYTAL